MDACFKDNMFINRKLLKTHLFANFGKDGGRKMIKIRLTKS